MMPVQMPFAGREVMHRQVVFVVVRTRARLAWRVDGDCGLAGSIAMHGIWQAAWEGDVGEVERLVQQDRGLLDAKFAGSTPLMSASAKSHLEVVRWLVDNGAAMNEQMVGGATALWFAAFDGRASVVKLLLEKGADATIGLFDSSPLCDASAHGKLEVVRVLLGHPRGKATINQRCFHGRTALWNACYQGQGAVVRLLLESGADPTLADDDGTTPMAIAKQESDPLFLGTAESIRSLPQNRRECAAALEVRFPHRLSVTLLF
jgi:ankyrin repeat protein